MSNTNFAQFTANTHAVGGRTMTETVAGLEVSRWGAGRLVRTLEGLRKEAQMCTTEAQYAPVKEQMDRLRAVLLHRPY